MKTMSISSGRELPSIQDISLSNKAGNMSNREYSSLGMSARDNPNRENSNRDNLNRDISNERKANFRYSNSLRSLTDFLMAKQRDEFKIIQFTKSSTNDSSQQNL